MKKIIALAILIGLLSCTDEVMQPYDKSQKPAEINIKGYSKPDVLQLRLNGKPVVINGSTSYTNTIETQLSFVVDEGETDQIEIYNNESGKQIAKYNINFNNIDQYKNLYFFNLPGIYLQTYAVKPQVNLGKVGMEFIFPNLGEVSGVSLDGIKGVLKRENGQVLAEFDRIEKNNFSPLKMYSFFSVTAPVYLELYKTGTSDPYFGSQIIQVKIKQDIGANMIVLQEKMENGKVVVIGDIDIADYL
ncbi:hypothetical protein IQ37_01970 [Chryseobacterium piperi]|uniref:Uncharacterized protein n=1 Tax=Chryseobacterium piperi TaxID=558152 RepID=A0A086BLZ9_9FLAO|nr:hypothetical protein [Chryseobacterium piperi]ASW75808.1 hypothetical protein CJF12_16990 [Chryseobacterium piperi]KFF29963.1 hypothetical protein IQ37_01970 [Chryseobacterium piperi]